MPDQTALLEDDPQKSCCRRLVMDQMPVVAAGAVFGALLSAIKSCASGRCWRRRHLHENIWRQFRRAFVVRKTCASCASALVFAIACAGLRHQDGRYAHFTSWSGPTRCRWSAAFVPRLRPVLEARHHAGRAVAPPVLGIGVGCCSSQPDVEAGLPQQLAGVLAVGMVAGSLVPQWWVHHATSSTMPWQAWRGRREPCRKQGASYNRGVFPKHRFFSACLSMPTNAAPVALPRMMLQKSPMPR